MKKLLLTFTIILSTNIFAISNAIAKTWPDKAMIGYVDLSATGSASLVSTVENLHNMNVIIFGFLPDSPTSLPNSEVVNQIINAEAPGTINLVSIGGDPSTQASITQVDVPAIMNFLSTYNMFDGVDLDIEHVNSSFSASAFMSSINDLASKLHSQGKFLTAAPAIVVNGGTATFQIPTTAQNVNMWIQSGDFDAVTVQAYNGFSDEENTTIISELFNDIKNSSIVNKNTKIIIGIPSNSGGTQGAPSIWGKFNLWNSGHSLAAIVNGIAEELQKLINEPQFGGLSAWSLNSDAMPSDPAYTGYMQNGNAGYFSQNVAPLVMSLK